VGSIILKGKLFTGYDMVENGEIKITGSMIEKVGEKGSIEIKKDDKVFDFSGLTIMPGLIDAHLHFFGGTSHDLMDWVTVNPQTAMLRSTLDAFRLLSSGFTTVRSLGDKTSIALSRAFKNGELLGPRVFSASYSIAQTGGDDDPRILPIDIANRLSYSYYCDSPWECRKAVRLCIRDGADVIKVYASGSFAGGGKIKRELTVEELSAIVDESHEAGLKVAAHAYGEEAISNVIKAGVDSIEHGLGLTEKLAEEIKEKNMCYVPTLTAYALSKNKGSEERKKLIERHFNEDMEIAKEKKLNIVAGTDLVGISEEPHGLNYLEIVHLSKYIGNLDALKAATVNAATCLGINAGILKENYIADIIAIKGNPLNDVNELEPNHVDFVMINGKIAKLNGILMPFGV